MAEEIYDPKTGEVIGEIDDTPEPQPEFQQARQPQQETLPGAGHSRRIDGLAIPAAAFTGGDFINQLNDGKFQADLHRALAKVASELQEYCRATQGKGKGTIDIKIDIAAEHEEPFRISANFKTKTPELPRPKSVAWFDPDNGNFTRFPQNQMQMFEQANARRIG